MSKFTDFWKNLSRKSHDVEIQETLDGVKEDVHELDEKLDQYETAGGTKKARVEKPGSASHSAKWDRCVAHVKENNSSADPYAVCTAMLGDETFKAMDESKFNAVLDKALNTIGIVAGGPMKGSDETASKAMAGFTSQKGLLERIRLNQKAKVEKGSSFKEAWSKVKPR